MKAFRLKADDFVAVKRINAFEKVCTGCNFACKSRVQHAPVWSLQDKRHQMMNDVRALCDAPHVPGLVDFVGAYHDSENGQVLDLQPC